MSDNEARKHLAMQLATGFAADCLAYLETIEESLQRSSSRIAFSSRVSFWRNQRGEIEGRLSSSPPSIPVEKRPAVRFSVETLANGQLKLLPGDVNE